jgi:hypothetical protein
MPAPNRPRYVKDRAELEEVLAQVRYRAGHEEAFLARVSPIVAACALDEPGDKDGLELITAAVALGLHMDDMAHGRWP